jgi:hypothetical protein
MAMTAGGAVESRTRVETQRAAENNAYVRKLLSQREPEFAAALTGAVRYISSCFGALDDQLHGRNVLGQQVEIDHHQHDGLAFVDGQDRLIDRLQFHEPLAARRGEELVRDQAALRREIAAAAIATKQACYQTHHWCGACTGRPSVPDSPPPGNRDGYPDRRSEHGSGRSD